MRAICRNSARASSRSVRMLATADILPRMPVPRDRDDHDRRPGNYGGEAENPPVSAGLSDGGGGLPGLDTQRPGHLRGGADRVLVQAVAEVAAAVVGVLHPVQRRQPGGGCLLYTSDAADDLT